MNPEALQAVALAVAAETSVDRVLTQIVEGLVARTAVALARVYLVASPATCKRRARERSVCPDQAQCLHAVVSGGRLHGGGGGVVKAGGLVPGGFPSERDFPASRCGHRGRRA